MRQIINAGAEAPARKTQARVQSTVLMLGIHVCSLGFPCRGHISSYIILILLKRKL